MDEFKMTVAKLRDMIKRDPESYLTEFETYYKRFKTLYDLQIRRLEHDIEEHIILMDFVGSVVNKYSKYTEEFVKLLYTMIKIHGINLAPRTRHQICLILFRMRKYNVVNSTDFLGALIELFGCQDKSLRSDLFKIVLDDLKIGFKKSHYNQSTRNKIFHTVFSRLTESSSKNIQYACLCILLEMWRRNIWRDEKTSNQICQAVFSKHYQVSFMALLSMKGNIQKIHELPDEDDEKNVLEAQDMISKNSGRIRVHRNSRSAKKFARKLKRSTKIVKKSEKTNEEPKNNDTSIIRLIYSPQQYAEKLSGLLNQDKNKLDYRILVLEVLSRIISVHDLIIPGIFEYCLKYLRPHQSGVIKIMNSLVQASHQHVPAECIHPVIETICNQFISLRNAPEVCSVGINSIREIYARAPHSADSIIANDLIQYSHDRKAERSVVSAARSLLQLLRSVNPGVLAKKYQILKPNAHNDQKNTSDLSSDENDDNEWSDCSDDEQIQSFDHDVCMERILTDEDFERIRNNRNNVETKELTNIEDIATVYNLKKQKPSKTTENGGEKYNPHKGWRYNTKASTTNVEKKKHKPFNMAKNKKDIRKKKSRSFQQRAKALKNMLLKKKKSRV